MTNDTPHEDGPAAAVDGSVRTPGTPHARDADTPAPGAARATDAPVVVPVQDDHGVPHPQHRTPVDLTGLGDDAPATPEERLERTVAVTTLGTTGVHALGTPLARALGAVGTRLGSDSVPGVSLSRTRGTTVVEVAVVAEYPARVVDVADEVREQVADAVGELVDGPVRVDVTVTDVHGPFDDRETAVDRARDAAGPAGERVRDAATRAADTVRDAAGRAGDAVRDAADATADRTADALDATGDVVQGTDDDTTRPSGGGTAARGAGTDAVVPDGSPGGEGLDADRTVEVVVDGGDDRPDVEVTVTVTDAGDDDARDGDPTDDTDATADAGATDDAAARDDAGAGDAADAPRTS